MSCSAPPSCIKPENLAVYNITATSVDLNWDTEATATGGYDYFVTSDGTVPDGSTTPTGSVASGTTTASLSSLTANTEYEVYVRSDCGSEDLSAWSTTAATFKTECGVFNVSFTENFDASSSGSTTSPNAPDCWSFINTGAGWTYVINSSFNSQSGSQSYRLYNGSDISGDYMLVSPEIAELTTEGVQLSFSVKGASGQELEVGTMSDPTDATTFNLLNTETLSSSSYEDIEVNITAGTDAYFAVRHGQTATFDSYYLDDFSFEALPSCITPTNLAVSNITLTTATIAWYTEATATGGYDYFLTSDSTVPDGSTTPTGSVASGTLTVNLTSLTMDTDYDVYVRSDCGGGDESAWSSAVSFSTPFLASVPFTENFNAAISEWNVTGWTRGDVSSRNVEGRDGSDVLSKNLYSTFPSGSFSTPSVGPVVSGNYLSFEFKSSYWLSPHDPVDAGDLDFTVDITDANGTTEEFSYTSNGTAGWEKVYIDLSDYVGENIGIEINASRNAGDFYLFFDNFKVGSIDGYVYLNDTDTWAPSTPVGNSTNTDKITIASNSNNPNLTGLTTAGNLEIFANSVLSVEDVLDLDGDIFNDGQIVFKSSAAKTAQFDTFTGTITGDHGTVQTERFIQAGTANNRAFRLVTSAVDAGTIYDNWQEGGNSPLGFGTHITGSDTGANGFDQTATGNPSMFSFNNATADQAGGAAWTEMPNTDATNLDAGMPYRLFVRGDRTIDLSSNDPTPKNTVLRAKGSLKTGTVPAVDLATGDGQFSFIGNPYQAIVNINTVTISGDVNDNYIYAWDANAGDNGAYVTVELPAGTNPASNPNVNNFLQPGQAVFIRNNTVVTTAGSIEFNEFSKSPSATQLSPFSDEELTKVDFQLFTTAAFANNSNPSDAIGLRFDENFNIDVNDADAGKLGNSGENLAIVQNNQLLSIEQRTFPVGEESIQLFINNYQHEDYVFKAIPQNLPEGKAVFVKDNYLDTVTEMDLENGHAFSVDQNIPESTSIFRFELAFENETLGVNNYLSEGISLYPVPVEDILHIANGIDTDLKVEVFNMLGQQVARANLTANQNQSISMQALEAGVYIVKISDGEAVYNQQIIKK